MKSTHFSVFIMLVAMVLSVSEISRAYADLPSGLLDEEINLDDILTDIPPDFDYRGASASEWSSLPFFTPADAGMIVSLRDSLKSKGAPDYFIPDIPDAELPLLSPFQSSILWYIQTRYAMLKPETVHGVCRTGYILQQPTPKAQGKYYFKAAAIQEKNIIFSLLAERDASEPRALDSYSSYAALSLDQGRSQIILGDFRPGYAQGLIFSRYGRSYANGVDVFSRDAEISGNTSFEETLFLRGFLGKTARGPASFQVFSSVRRLDATIDENGKATMIGDSGIHKAGFPRDNLAETIQGGHVSLRWGRIGELSATGAISRYSPSLAQRPGERYVNNPSGDTFVHTGFAGNLQLKPVVVFFEHAELQNAGGATVGGIEIRKKKAGASLLYRDYSPDYWSRHAGGFSSFGYTANERGLYSSAEIELPLSLKFSASLDMARLMSRTYSRDLPDTRMRACFSLYKYFRNSCTGVITVRSVQDNETNKERKNYRFCFEKKPNRSSPLGWKTITVWSESEGKGGPFFSTALTFRGKRSWNLRCSAGLFSIPDYDSRLYISEENVPGRSYTMPVWGRGETAVMLLVWGPVSCRYRFIHSDLMQTVQECTVQSDILF
ncbi:MAG: hypothetical protein Q8O92_13280 [Candidatus Latescibacter sp.]|nr:hypothetical protein [Candidatus Latescibacter sp.]